MITRVSTPRLGLLFFFSACLIWSGCSALIPQSHYIWSKNYALDINGGDCSSPEMNDGKPQDIRETWITRCWTDGLCNY